MTQSTNCARKRSAARAELELEGVVRTCVVLEQCRVHMNYTLTLHYLKCLYCTGSSFYLEGKVFVLFLGKLQEKKSTFLLFHDITQDVKTT